MFSASRTTTDVTPSARRLTGSLRDIGYDFVAALADVVDNSVAAGATQVDIEIVFDGYESYVLIADDGYGMTEAQLHEARSPRASQASATVEGSASTTSPETSRLEEVGWCFVAGMPSCV